MQELVCNGIIISKCTYGVVIAEELNDETVQHIEQLLDQH